MNPLSAAAATLGWLHPAEPWPLVGFAMIAFWLIVLAAVLWFVRTKWPKDPDEPPSSPHP